MGLGLPFSYFNFLDTKTFIDLKIVLSIRLGTELVRVCLGELQEEALCSACK